MATPHRPALRARSLEAATGATIDFVVGPLMDLQTMAAVLEDAGAVNLMPCPAAADP